MSSNRFRLLASDDEEKCKENGSIHLKPILVDAAKAMVELEATVAKTSAKIEEVESLSNGIITGLAGIEAVLKQMHVDFIRAIQSDGKAPIKVLWTVAACLCVMSIMFTLLITNTELNIKNLLNVRPHDNNTGLEK